MSSKVFLSSVMLLSSVSVVSAANLSGRWTGSPTCQYSEFNDQGSVVTGNCNNSGFHHLFNGQYNGPSMIQGTLTRVDLNQNCQLTVPASIMIMGDNQIQITQNDGWNGCGVATGHGQGSEIWTRAGGSVITEGGGGGGGGGGLLPPPNSGPVTGRGRENIEGGYGEIEATFYPQAGRLSATTRAVTESTLNGVHAAGFIVGLDQQGQALFVTRTFDIPTSCGKADFTCQTTTAVGSYEEQVNPIIARYVTRLEVHVTSRGDNMWSRLLNNVRQGVNTYNNLPPEVKAAIAAAAM